MNMIVANIFSIVCVVGAIYLMARGIDGWGWLLLVSLFGLHTYK